MALSEVWRYDPNLEGTPTPFDVWVEPRTNAPIAVATRFRQSGEGIQLVPESTITIRVRWRSDVSSAALWRDPEGYNWLTDGYVEVGRRSWVDLQLTRYGAITAGVLPQVPVEVIPRGSQDGWELRGAEGERISELVIGQFETAGGIPVAVIGTAERGGPVHGPVWWLHPEPSGVRRRAGRANGVEGGDRRA